MRLNYFLDKTSSVPLYAQLYQQLKQAIYQGEIKCGEKLPSKRRLCEFLKISQNTVETAYNQLLAEGYIESQIRKGFFVCFQVELQLQSTNFHLISHSKYKPPVFDYDFNPNLIDQQNFPFETWRKCGRNHYRISQNAWLGLGDPQGEYVLRQQIARYLAESRGVNCQPEQIIIAPGMENCLQQLILLFNQLYPSSDFTYAMEAYGYEKAEKVLQLYQKKIIKIPLNKETNELDLNLFSQNKMNIAYLTPSNLYPFGQVLSITQRQKILEWVNQAEDRYIIEDDYDSEFRYKGKPIPSLQSLDFNQKIIYFGSFSKLLMPSLRISFMVLPEKLYSCYQQYCGFFSSSISRLEQYRLANFMAEGYFEKHINRMRKIYRKKMEFLCELLKKYSPRIRHYGEHSGFYLLIELTQENRELEELSLLARKQQIKIYPIELAQRKLIVLGFGNLQEIEIQKGITALLMSWGI